MILISFADINTPGSLELLATSLNICSGVEASYDDSWGGCNGGGDRICLKSTAVDKGVLASYSPSSVLGVGALELV